MYLKPMKRHRILELGQVTLTTLVGVLVLFFAFYWTMRLCPTVNITPR